MGKINRLVEEQRERMEGEAYVYKQFKAKLKERGGRMEGGKFGEWCVDGTKLGEMGDTLDRIYLQLKRQTSYIPKNIRNQKKLDLGDSSFRKTLKIRVLLNKAQRQAVKHLLK